MLHAVVHGRLFARYCVLPTAEGPCRLRFHIQVRICRVVVHRSLIAIFIPAPLVGLYLRRGIIVSKSLLEEVLLSSREVQDGNFTLYDRRCYRCISDRLSNRHQLCISYIIPGVDLPMKAIRNSLRAGYPK